MLCKEGFRARKLHFALSLSSISNVKKTLTLTPSHSFLTEAKSSVPYTPTIPTTQGLQLPESRSKKNRNGGLSRKTGR